jgi:SpoVK/Ycf46/Vps4 family AAA+-type ATPase
MTAGPILAALAILMTLVLIAIEASLRDARSDLRGDLRFDRGPPDEDLHDALVGFGVMDDRLGPNEPIFTVFEPSELLAVDHLRGMDTVDDLLRELAERVRETRRSPRRRPRRPTSILLCGPPGGAMTIIAHELARGFRARLVQVFATKALPNTNGGAQPKIAVAVNQARDHPPSVLLLDEFEHVAAASVRDADRLRAANDLVGEALRPMYGTSHVVVGIYTVYDDHPVPRRITGVFEHVLAVDLPGLERALRVHALRAEDRDLSRAVSGARLAEPPDVTPPPWHSAA